MTWAVGLLSSFAQAQARVKACAGPQADNGTTLRLRCAVLPLHGHMSPPTPLPLPLVLPRSCTS